MLNSIKTFFSSVAGIVIGVLAAALGILAIVLQLKDKKLESLESQVQLVNTQKDADVLESKINQEAAQVAGDNKQLDTYQQAAALLEEKRQQISQQQPSTPQNIEDYWNKK